MIRRLFFYFAGVLILGLGIVLNTKTGLGVAAINSFPFAISKMSGLTLGNATTILYVAFILAQLLIYRKVAFKVLLQIPFSYLMGMIIDFYDTILDFGVPALPGALALLLGAILLTALGAYMMVAMDLIPNPADGLVNAIAKAIGKEFGKTKLMFDCCMIATTITISLVFAHRLIGIGLGTIVSAALIGNIIVAYSRLFNSYFKKVVENSISKPVYEESEA